MNGQGVRHHRGKNGQQVKTLRSLRRAWDAVEGKSGDWADHHAGGSIKLKLALEADPVEVQRQVLALADALRREVVVG